MRPLKEVEGPVVESRPQQDTRLSLGRGGTDKGRSRSKNRSKSRSQSRSRSRSRRQMAGWIETKFNKILTHWEGFLDTDYDKEPKKETPAKKATPGTKKVESPVEAEKPTRGGRREAPEPKEEAIEPGGLPEVCRKSAGGLPEFGRKCAKFK